jgi:hypothetical protein
MSYLHEKKAGQQKKKVPKRINTNPKFMIRTPPQQMKSLWALARC